MESQLRLGPGLLQGSRLRLGLGQSQSQGWGQGWGQGQAGHAD